MAHSSEDLRNIALIRHGESGVARAIAVTHLDHDNTDFDKLVADLRQAFGHAVVPVSYPDVCGAGFKTVHSVLAEQGPKWRQYHEWIEEDEAEIDDELMAHYLDKGALEPGEFELNLARAMATGKLVPVFALAPSKQLGVEALLAFAA